MGGADGRAGHRERERSRYLDVRDPLRILRPLKSDCSRSSVPKRPEGARDGPQQPSDSTQAEHPRQRAALDDGHGRPGTAETAGSRWGGKADDGARDRQRRPARPGSTWARKQRPGVCGGGEVPAPGCECHRRRPRELRDLRQLCRVGLTLTPLFPTPSPGVRGLGGRRAPLPVVQKRWVTAAQVDQVDNTSTRTQLVAACAWSRLAGCRAAERCFAFPGMAVRAKRRNSADDDLRKYVPTSVGEGQ